MSQSILGPAGRIDLDGLPEPRVIRSPDFETIRAELISKLRARVPDFDAVLESDPAVKLIEVFAWELMLDRQRVNNAAKANLLAFAQGSDLDHLAAFYGVERKDDESDDRLRERVRQRIQGFSAAGGRAHYRFHALSASTDVADVAVFSPRDGVVRIVVLSAEGSGEPTEELLATVRERVIADDVKVLTDRVEVAGAEIVPVAVQATVELLPSTPRATFDNLAGRLRDAFAQDRGLEWDVTRSWLMAQLHVAGVHRVVLDTPSDDVVIGSTQAAALDDVKLTFAGRGK